MSDKKPRPKVRGNGQGTAYQRPGQKTWTVEVVVGKRYPNGDVTKPKRPVRKTRGGFLTKRAALEYVPILKGKPVADVSMTLEDVYLSWKSSYENRVDPSTMACYVSAYKHFRDVHGVWMKDISSESLQTCMDACSAGKRTHQNMRTIAGLLWHYAMDKGIVDRDVTRNLYTGKGRSVQREPLTPEEEQAVFRAIGTERYAEYVYCLCWLGFRPGELLQLRKDQLFCANLAEKPEDDPIPVWYFVNGKKTDAGRDRIVVIHDKILPFILERVYIPGTDLLFPRYVFTRPGKNPPAFLRFQEMSDAFFRESVFKPMMKRLGIAEGKVPYGARHTFANKLKKASGDEKDKASLFGHSSYDFTRTAYQTSDLADLKEVIDSM